MSQPHAVVTRAAALAPRLLENARRTEEAQRVLPEHFDALAEAGNGASRRILSQVMVTGMFWTVLWPRRVLVSCAVVAVSGCGGRADDPQATVQPSLASLARVGVSLEGRAAWRPHLRWPDGCEDAFQASHAGTDGGLTFTSMGDGVSLVEVVCAAGTYQPSMVRMRMVESADDLQATALVFPVYQSTDGQQVTLVRETEVWGESVVQAGEHVLVVLALARQTADCGVWTRYSLAGAEPKVVAAAARLDCPTPAGEPATLSPTRPPAGWVSLPRKD